jgi:hypothetical protein
MLLFILCYIIFLPLVSGYNLPPMRDNQVLQIVWVETTQEKWTAEDKITARYEIDASLRWWENLVLVSYSTQESTYKTDVDILSLDVCHHREWLPVNSGLTFYMISTKPYNKPLVCDGVNVLDYTDNQGRAIYWGNLTSSILFRAGFVHTLGHLHGARDGPSKDIMDKDVFIESYQNYTVAGSTLDAIRAFRR